MTLTASQCDNSAPPPLPQTFNRGQGQLHRWTKSNPVKVGFNQKCQSGGHAKASRRDGFHKHLSHRGEHNGAAMLCYLNKYICFRTNVRMINATLRMNARNVHNCVCFINRRGFSVSAPDLILSKV